MTVSLKHTFTSAKADGADSSLVQPSNWNAEHTMTAVAGVVIGRDTSGAGAVQELPIAVTSGGNVGLGINTPADKLNVSDGTVNVQVNPVAASSIGYVGTRSNHAFGITTNNTECLRINTAGKVWQIVNGTTTSQSYAFGDGTTSYAQLSGYRDSSTTGHLSFYTLTSGTPTEYLRIASTGAFGLSGANYGTNGQVLTSSGSGAAPTWTSASGGSLLRVTTFTSSGTWTKGSGTNKVRAYGVGGGGGGEASANPGTGGGGAYCEEFIDVTSVSTVTVTVGSGGSGGYYGGASDGGNTSFGGYWTAGGGTGNPFGSGGRMPGGTATGGGTLNINGPTGIYAAGTYFGDWPAYGAGGPGAYNSGTASLAIGQPGVVIVEEYA